MYFQKLGKGAGSRGCIARIYQKEHLTMEEQSFEKESLRRDRAWRFLHPLVRLYFRKFHCSMETVDVEGPYLLIANHACDLDPIFVGLSSPKRPLTYVASEHLMRMGFITKVLTRYLSVIPRPKASMALDTIRSVTKALKAGTPVVLFAEGDNTWNGISGSVFPATGKLARIMKVPLVTYRMEGNYLTKPRWAAGTRKGYVKGRIAHVYQPDELAKMRPEEIDACIDRDIYVDADALQQQDPIRFKGRRRAENIEKAVFICPECEKIGTIHSKGAEVYCSTCGLLASIDPYGSFTKGRFKYLSEWDGWQKDIFRSYLREGKEGEFFPADAVLTHLTTGEQQQVRIALDPAEHALVIDGRPVQMTSISDLSMVRTNRLLYTDENGYYEIRTDTGMLRPYLLAWMELNKEVE